MPEIGVKTISKPRRPAPRTRTRKPVKVYGPPEPRKLASVNPGQSDRMRTPAQKAHDAEVTAAVVRLQRNKVIRATRHRTPFKDIAKFIAKGLRDNPANRAPTKVLSDPRQIAAAERKLGHKLPRIKGDVGATIAPTVGTGGLSRVAAGVARGFAKHPGTASRQTLKGFQMMAEGLAVAPYALGAQTLSGAKHGDPLRGARTLGKAMTVGTVEDLKRRYGGVNKAGGVQRLAERISKEGAAPEIVDALGLGVPVARGVDLGLGAAARAGKLGARAERVVTRERPNLRTTGGESTVQPTPKGLVAASRKATKDKRTRKAIDRRVTKADIRAEAEPGASAGAKGPVDAVVREAHNKGEVVLAKRLTGGRKISKGRMNRAIKHEQARMKSRRLHSQRHETGREVVRGSNRALASLNRWERKGFKTALQLGVRTPAAARQAIDRRLTIIDRARTAGEDIPTARDEVLTLRELHANAEKAFTPKLGEVADAEVGRGARLGEGDPGLGRTATKRAKRAESRRLQQQARVLAVTRGGTPIKQALARAKRDVTRAEAVKATAQKVATRATLKASYQTGHAASTAKAVTRTIDAQIKRNDLIVANHLKVAERHRAAGNEDAQNAALVRAQNARARGVALTAQRAAVQPGYRRAVQRANSAADNASRNVEAADADLRLRGQRHKQLKRAKKRDKRTVVGQEPLRDFANRVRAERPEGFTEPGYFPSRQRPGARFAPFTIGGSKATEAPKAYGGKLFEAGREADDLAIYGQALAQNIKRKHNWGLVADTIARHSFDWGHGKRFKEISAEIERRGINPDSVQIFDIGMLDGAAKEAAKEGVDLSTEKSLHDALNQAVVASDGSNLIASNRRLIVVPKAAGEEILADTAPSNALGRAYDITKGWQSKLLLGTSPAWLGFQAGSNALLTGISGTGPMSLAKSVAWWRGLSDEQRASLEPLLGTGAFHGDVTPPRMGATAADSQIHAAWTALRNTPFWHKPRKAVGGRAVRDLNPLNALFRIDNAQNNFFRRGVLYNRVSKDAYGRMGKETAKIQNLQDRLAGILKLPPEKQVKAVLRDRDAIEAHAKAVNDFLGDFTTMTKGQRRYLNRAVMFPAFLRFSLKFAFHTMPTEHPLMTAIALKLGQLQAEETQKLLGGNALPYQLGKFYWNDDGTLKSVNVGRLNPVLNAATQITGPKDLAGFLPPIIQSVIDQLAGRRVGSFGGDWDVRGKEGTDAWRGEPGKETVDRARIFANQNLGGLIAPLREIEKARSRGLPLGDDSLPFSRRPTTPDDADVALGNKRHAAQVKGSALSRVLQTTFGAPFLGAPDDALHATSLARAKNAADKLKRQAEQFPETKKFDHGYQSDAWRALLAKRKAADALVNTIQARGPVAPPKAEPKTPPLSEAEQAAKRLYDQLSGAADPTSKVYEQMQRQAYLLAHGR